LLAASQSDVPGRLEKLETAIVRFAGGSLLPVQIESAWPHKDLWVLKLAGIDSVNAAEQFRGSELCVAAEERGALPEGEYFQSDLIGCEVVEAGTTKVLGKVEGWQQFGGPPLLQLQVGGREVLIPFVPSICTQVDVAGRKILVEMPEGLLEL
jgi:16S rRNA processing protein RimM